MSKNKDFYNSNSIENYYSLASEANEAFSKTVEFATMQKYISFWDRIIEFGCWEGSKIWSFPRDRGYKLCGLDISKSGIELAKNKYSWIDFTVADFGSMDSKYKNSFDVAMSFFVIEHVDDPEDLIRAMKNSITNNWKIILWFPNYWSPLFPSPPTLYKKNFIKKCGIILSRIFFSKSKYYSSVIPITEEYQSDYDTVSEIRMKPFLTLLKDRYWLEVLYCDSGWNNLGWNPLFILYKPFKFLSKFWWFSHLGPQCFCILKPCQN